MSSLSEIDRDLDQIAVDSARLTEVQKRVAAAARLSLAQADEELEALAAGAGELRAAQPDPSGARTLRRRVDTEPPPPPVVDDDGPPSGQIDVPDDVLKSAELPAVLALQEPAPAEAALSLDLDDAVGDAGEPDDLAPVPTSASTPLPADFAASLAPPRSSEDPSSDTRSLADDPNADLASLLGESDPMRDEGAAPLPAGDLEPEPTTMFTAEDAERYSRPAPPMPEDDLAEPSDVELDLDADMLEIEEEEEVEPAAPAAARPKTAPPPPPPRTAPPPPPGARPSEAPPPKGFLGKLLQRKP